MNSFVVSMNFDYLPAPVPPLHVSIVQGVILPPVYYQVPVFQPAPNYSCSVAGTIAPYVPSCAETFFPTPPPAHQTLVPIYRSSEPALSLVKRKVNYQEKPSHLGNFIKSQAQSTPLNLNVEPCASTSIPAWSNWMSRKSRNLSYLETRPKPYPPQVEQGPSYPHISKFNHAGSVEKPQNKDAELSSESRNRADNLWSTYHFGEIPKRASDEQTKPPSTAGSLDFATPVSSNVVKRLEKRKTNGKMDVKATVTISNRGNPKLKPVKDDTQWFLEEMAKLRTIPLTVDQHLEMMNLLKGELTPIRFTKPKRHGKMRQCQQTSYSLKRFYTDIVLRRFKQKQDQEESLPYLISEGKRQHFDSQMKWVAKINPSEFRKYFLVLVNEQSRRTADASFVIATAEHSFHTRSCPKQNEAVCSGPTAGVTSSVRVDVDAGGQANKNTENSEAIRQGLLMNGGAMRILGEKK